MARDNKAIGIDLGTTYCCVGVYCFDRVEIITNEQGNRTTPSMLAFNETERLVGEGAKNQIAFNPRNTVFEIKRLMGRSFSDRHVQSDMLHWPFTVERGSEGKPVIRVDSKGEYKTFAPEQISGLLLGKMKQIAQLFLGSDVEKAVVTVPAYFNDAQRQATKHAAELAGLEVLQLLNEPNAAAIAYGLDTKTYSSKNGKTILVFDVGGGTFDVSVITIERGSFNVKAVGGDTHLGGTDFDQRMVNHFVEEFKRKCKLDISRDARALQRLRNACERAKRALSAAAVTDIHIDSLYEGRDFSSKISRAKFEDMNSDLFIKCVDGVKQCLQSAEIAKERIDEVVLVGGSTRILKLQQLLQDFFGDKKLCRSINPDEAVAYGAAVQAAVLSGQCSDVILSDVTPLSLGVEVKGNIMSVVVPKNSRIPVNKVKRFCTADDNQTVVDLPVYEGERTVATDNNLLGKFSLDGIPADLRGREHVDVCFEIDGNGILKVSAENESAGSNNITISNESCRLSKEEMDRMMFDAKRFEAEDEKASRKHKARITLENYAYEIRNNAREKRVRGMKKGGRAEKLEKLTSEAIEWVDNHDDAEIEDLEIKLRDLKATCDGLL